MHYPILVASASAALFGISTPLAKILVAEVPPVALAGLLHLGSGVGLLAWGRSHLTSDPANHRLPGIPVNRRAPW